MLHTTRFSVLLGMFFVFAGCVSRPPSSDLLRLSHLDETLVDLDGPETRQIYNPITLLQQGEAYSVKGDYAAASESYQRFLELYPVHRMAAFAHYALGISYVNQIESSDRDPTPIEQARSAFEQVLRHYPETPYAQSAAQQMGSLARQEAEHQFGIGYYYYKQKAYTAAIARFEKALAEGRHDKVTEETLYYLGRSYAKSGHGERAKEIFSDLEEQYPRSAYLKKRPRL